MKRACFLFLVGYALSCGLAFASSGHYVNGVEGIKAATLPPEGFYVREYSVYYNAPEYRDKNNKIVNNDFKLNVYCQVTRLIYSSNISVLGGNLLFDAVVPFQYTDNSFKTGQSSPRTSEDMFGLGDILLEPLLLSWHGDRYDAAIGTGLYIPTGYFSKNHPASPGKGFYTVMFTAGGTVYFDKERTWSASILSRYEVNTQQNETDITPGNDFHFEWGVGKTFNKTMTVGAAGYSSWQTTDDSGSGATDDRTTIYGIGPEVAFDIPAYTTSVSLRFIKEFSGQNSSQGSIGTLTLTKRF